MPVRRHRSRSLRRCGQESWASAGIIHDWAVGKESAPDVKRHCRNICLDDDRKHVRSDVITKRLSKIGGGNPEGGTLHRDLMRVLPCMGLGFVGMITDVVGSSQFAKMIKPSRMLKLISREFPDRFRSVMGQKKMQRLYSGICSALRLKELLSGRSMQIFAGRRRTI